MPGLISGRYSTVWGTPNAMHPPNSESLSSAVVLITTVSAGLFNRLHQLPKGSPQRTWAWFPEADRLHRRMRAVVNVQRQQRGSAGTHIPFQNQRADEVVGEAGWS
jgi:hypothetical protein